MDYLPDTNVFIAWTRHAHPAITKQIEIHRRATWLSSIVVFELCYGAFLSDRPDVHLRQLDGYGIPVLDFDRNDARAAGDVRAKLKRAGTPIGPYDLLIAGQALARGLVLVTSNVREFGRVDGLIVEDWAS